MEQTLVESVAQDAHEVHVGARIPPPAEQVARWIAILAKRLGIVEERLSKGQIIEQPLGYVEGSFGRALDVGVREQLALANRRISQLIAENAAEEKRHAVTAAALEKFQSACADQTIQIMELRGEIMRGREAVARVVELEAELERMRRTNAGSAPFAQLDRLRQVVLHGGAMTVEQLITEAIDEIHAPCPDCKAMQEQIDSLHEQIPVGIGG